jgi:acetyl esterase
MEAPAGAIVAVHGGSWVAGSFETHDALWRGIAQACRALVIAPDYRLAPEHPWPAALDDVIDCVRKVREAAGELGIDPARIVLLGEEAGGHLATLAALALGRDGDLPLLAQVLVSPILAAPGLPVAGSVLSSLLDSLYPPVSRPAGRLIERLTEQAVAGWALTGGESASPAAVWPLEAERLTFLPETYLLSAGLDPWHDHAVAWRDRLQAAGVSAMHECFDGMVHGFLSMGGALAAAGHGQSRIAQFLRPLMRASLT